MPTTMLTLEFKSSIDASDFVDSCIAYGVGEGHRSGRLVDVDGTTEQRSRVIRLARDLGGWIL